MPPRKDSERKKKGRITNQHRHHEACQGCGDPVTMIARCKKIADFFAE